MDAGRDDRAQAVDRLQVVDRGGQQAVQVAEGRGHHIGHRRPDVWNAQPEQQPSQRSSPGGLDGPAEVPDRRLAEPVEGANAVVVQREHPGHVLQDALTNEQVDPLLAEALDVHRSPGCEVFDASPDLSGTGMVRAERGRLTLRTNERSATCRTRRREGPGGQPFGPLDQHGTQHLGDDVTGLADHHHVPRADVLLADLVGVVQGGRGNR